MALLLEQKFYAKYLPRYSAVELRHIFYHDPLLRTKYILNRKMPPALAVKAAIDRSQSRRHIAGGDGQTSVLQSRGTIPTDSSFASAETSDYLRAALRQPCVLQKQVRDTIEMLGGDTSRTPHIGNSCDTTDTDGDTSMSDEYDEQGEGYYVASDSDDNDGDSDEYKASTPQKKNKRNARGGQRVPGSRTAKYKAPRSKTNHNAKLAGRKGTRRVINAPDTYNGSTRDQITTRETAAAMAEFLGVRNGMGRQASVPAALATIMNSITQLMAETRTVSQTLQSQATAMQPVQAANFGQNAAPFMGPVDVYSMPAGGPMSNSPVNALRSGSRADAALDYRTVLASFTHTVTRLNALVSRVESQCLELATTVADSRLLELERRSSAKRLVKEVLTHIDRAFSPDGGGALLQKQFYFDLSPTVVTNHGLGQAGGDSTVAGSPRGPYTVFLRNIIFSEYLNRLPMLQGDAVPLRGSGTSTNSRPRSTITGQSNSRLRGLLPVHQKHSLKPSTLPVGATGPDTALYVCPVTQARRSDQRVRELHNFVGSRIGRYINGYDELVVPIIEEERLQEGSATCNLYLFIDCLNVVEIFSNGYLRPADYMAPASGGLHPSAADLLLHQQPAVNAGIERTTFGLPFGNGVPSCPKVEFVSSRLRYLVRCCLHSMTHIVSLLHPEVRADHILTHSHPVYTKISNVYEPTGIVKRR